MSIPFALIGPGRVGSAVGKALYRAGYPLVSVVGRRSCSAATACNFIGCDASVATTDPGEVYKARLILIAVPDDQIAPVAADVQQRSELSPDTLLLHFSGVLAADCMRCSGSAARLFSLHPLLSCADPQDAFDRLGQAYYIGEGDEEAAPVVTELVGKLGGHFQPLAAADKHLYHTAACLASNYLVTLVAEAGKIFGLAGISPAKGPAMLTPLLQATLDNLTRHGVHQGLTGPIVRGDTGTLERHLTALARQAPELVNIYLGLGLRTALLARESGRLKETDFKKIVAMFGDHSISQ